MMTTQIETSMLPDDLEERWEAMEPNERRDFLTHWRERNAAGALGWRDRRRIRKLLGGQPLTVGSAVDRNARLIEEDEAERKAYLRLVRLYGHEGQRAIANLACRAITVHPGAPYSQLEAWAEKAYVRGDVG